MKVPGFPDSRWGVLFLGSRNDRNVNDGNFLCTPRVLHELPKIAVTRWRKR